MSAPEMSQPPQPTASKPKSKGLLITGLVFLALSLVLIVMGVMGMSSMQQGAAALQEQDETKNVDESLTVPGVTEVTLPPQKYKIWVNVSDPSKYQNDEGGFDFDQFEKPPVKWSISGAGDVPISPSMNFHVNNSVAVGDFTIAEAGDYKITAEVEEGVEIADSFTVNDNAMEKALEEIGGAVGGFFQMMGGFVCGGIFGLIGLILTLVHFIKGN